MRTPANTWPSKGLVAAALHLWRSAPARERRDVLILAVMTPGMLFVFAMIWGALPA